MGRAWKCGGVEIIIPQGVEVKAFSDGRTPTIGIRFKYRGVPCREWSLSAANPKTAAQNIALASAKLTAVQDEIKRGVFKYGEHFPDSKRCKLFGEYSTKGVLCKSFFDDYVAWVRPRVENITGDYYSKTLDRHIRPSWDKRPVAMLTRPNLKLWLAELADTGMLLKSVRNIVIPFKCALDLAVGEGKLKHNPFADIKLGDEWPKKQRASDYSPDPFSESERVAILKADPHQGRRNMFTTWWWGGYREEEILALKWTEVDFENERVRVCRVNSRGKIEERTKTDSSLRWVPMIGPVKEALLDQRAITKLKPHGFVFENPETGRPYKWTQSLSNSQWPNLLKRAKVRHRGANQCRHTFASIMLEREGVENVGVWSKIMGHKNVAITLTAYARMIEEVSPKHKHGFKLRNNDYSKVAA